MTVEVNLDGCDDSSTFSFELTESELRTLKRLEEASKKASEYQCQPTIRVIQKEEA